MCVVSMIGDHYNDHFKDYEKIFIPQHRQPITDPSGNIQFPIVNEPNVNSLKGIGRDEFESLKKEVEHMKKLLIKAKLYDEQNNEPNCEIEEKMEFLRKVADLVGINLDDVIGKSKNINTNV